MATKPTAAPAIDMATLQTLVQQMMAAQAAPAAAKAAKPAAAKGDALETARNLKVVSAEWRFTEAKKKPYLVVTFELAGKKLNNVTIWA